METGDGPPLFLWSDRLDTDLVQFLALRYVVTVEAKDGKIIYGLYERPPF